MRKMAKTSHKPEIDTAQYNWFVTKQAEGVPISGPILQAQAAQLAEANPTASTSSTDSTPYVASKGWVNCWKKRHGITAIKVSGEIQSADEEAAEAFVPKLQRLIEEEGLVPVQIFNTDDTGLFFKMTPYHTLAECCLSVTKL